MTEAKKGRVLVAEDEQAMANALKLKLEGEGFEVVTVNNGKKALDELADGSYDVILLDLMMPEVDGFTVLEKMKNHGTKETVIVMSNLGQAEDIDKAKSLGAKDYLVKADTSLSEIVKKVKAKL